MRTLIAALGVSLLACGCGGGGSDDTGDDDVSAVDAGTPDAIGATGYTAHGGYTGAYALAAAIHDDVRLLQLDGSRILDTGEVNPGVLQSTWNYRFVSPSTGVGVQVLFYTDMYAVNTSDINPEGLLLIDNAWIDHIDSDVTLDKAVAGGFVPGLTDPNVRIEMSLVPQTLFDGVPDPHWQLNKVTAPPGEAPVFEHWNVIYISSDQIYVVCDAGGNCSQV